MPGGAPYDPDTEVRGHYDLPPEIPDPDDLYLQYLDRLEDEFETEPLSLAEFSEELENFLWVGESEDVDW